MIFIIHGAYGNPKENWIPWLKKDLEKLDEIVVTPEFPTPEEQNLGNWIRNFSPYIKSLDNNSILIGHSLGCPFILNVLERIDITVNAAFFVAGFHTLLNHPIDEINKTFVDKKFNWEKIKNNCNNFIMFSGDNDPYISIDIARDLAKNTEADFKIVKGGGHLNNTSGFNKFENLAKEVKKYI